MHFFSRRHQRSLLTYLTMGIVLLFPFSGRSAGEIDPVKIDSGYQSGVTIPVEGGGIPNPYGSTNTQAVDQTQYGNACANGGVSDFSSGCNNVTPPPQEDEGDNDPCRKFPGDPACQSGNSCGPGMVRDSTGRCGKDPNFGGTDCGHGTYTTGVGGRCICNPGYTLDSNYKCNKRTGEPENPYEACKAQALQAVSRCEGSYGSAGSACATTRVDGIVQQAQSANEQQLRQSQNNSQACGGTAQAYQNAAGQLSGVQSSCQSSVNQCSSACATARNAIQQCPHPEVTARAQSVGTAQQSCTSGELAGRPQQIAQTSNSLRQVGAGDASRCNQNTAAATSTNPSQQGGGGAVNTASGNLKQDAGNVTPGSGPGAGGDTSGNFAYQPGTNPTAGNPSSTADSGGSGIDETYNVSGKNASTLSSGGAGDMTAANAALAALPGTPSHANNTEENEIQSGKESATGASSGVSSAGGRGGRLMLLPRKAGAAGVENMETLKAAGKTEEETPDLSAFLPGQRKIAGGTLAGLNGCRIPNPQKPSECAVPHGPSANIWSKMKERFEEFRFMRPSQFFMNEE